MSHHLDTPLAAQTGQLYIDDLYVFPGAASTVFIVQSGLTPAVAERQRDSGFPYVVPA